MRTDHHKLIWKCCCYEAKRQTVHDDRRLQSLKNVKYKLPLPSGHGKLSYVALEN